MRVRVVLRSTRSGRLVRPIVRDYCAEHGIPYREGSMPASYREVARYLGRVSTEART